MIKLTLVLMNSILLQFIQSFDSPELEKRFLVKEGRPARGKGPEARRRLAPLTAHNSS